MALVIKAFGVLGFHKTIRLRHGGQDRLGFYGSGLERMPAIHSTFALHVVRPVHILLPVCSYQLRHG